MPRSADSSADRAARLTRLAKWWPTLLITALGLVLLWPIPLGQMPLSADHTVHLTRTWMWAQELSHGNVRGWSPVWFFGTPVGELYPVLGDAIVIGVRVLSFGLLEWPAAYALGFTLVFLTQGWVLLRAGKALGWGVVPGLVAATLALVDVGSYREGGFIYTVYYGVWPQALATSFTWLGLAELSRLPDAKTPAAARRTLVHAGAAMGAALLAHPMSMAVLALAGPAVVFVTGLGSTSRLRQATARGLIAGALGFALALWWVAPMLSHRAWMASYGWLWQPLDVLFPRAMEGRWAQSMPPLAGHCVTGGILLVALVGNRAARAFAVVAIGLWVMSSRDIPWEFRLDLVSEGFTHLQYQRFLTAAKPGLFLMAGALVGGVVHLARNLWRLGGTPSRVLSGLGAALVLATLGVIATQQREEFEKNPVSEIQQTRIPRLPELDSDYAELASWMREQWRARDRDYRFVVHDQRNIHWFMDLPVSTDGAPILKLGFTPGDNFVHKPERGSQDLLDRAQVRYEIRRGQRKRRGEVARFGMLSVVERASWPTTSIAQLHGDGSVEVLENDAGRVRVRVRDTEGPTRLLFGIGGFPRWTLSGPEGPIEWVEAPAAGYGPGATQQDRLEGSARGGKVDGDDGTEPTLIAADVTDGEYTLTYERWRTTDIVAALLSAMATGLAIVLLGWPRSAEGLRGAFDRLVKRLAILGHPVVWAAVAIAVAGGLYVKVQRGHAARAGSAIELALSGRASVLAHVQPGFTKADMLIRPALVFERRHARPAVAAFERVSPGEVITGWVALEDDDTKRKREGTVSVLIEVRAAGDGPWISLFEKRLPHRPGRIPLRLDLGELADQPVDVRVSSEIDGKRGPELGVALELSGGDR